MIALKQVLVATDFSPTSDVALAYGRAVARMFGAALHVLHVMENPFLRPTTADPRTLEAAAWRALNEQLTEEDGRELRGRVVMETADGIADGIVDYAKTAGIDLVVMGTNGCGALSQLLVGSVAERVVRTAPCPVLTVRHPEHEFLFPEPKPCRSCRSGIH